MSAYFRLSPSRLCVAVMFAGYTLTILIVILLPIVLLGRYLLCLILLGALFYFLRRDAWLSLPSSTLAISIEGRSIKLLRCDGTELSGQIVDSSVVTPLMTILNVQVAGAEGRSNVVLFPDSLDKVRFRELRVLLKWGEDS